MQHNYFQPIISAVVRAGVCVCECVLFLFTVVREACGLLTRRKTWNNFCCLMFGSTRPGCYDGWMGAKRQHQTRGIDQVLLTCCCRVLTFFFRSFVFVFFRWSGEYAVTALHPPRHASCRALYLGGLKLRCGQENTTAVPLDFSSLVLVRPPPFVHVPPDSFLERKSGPL